MKLVFDESLSPRLVGVTGDRFPESESALRNGLAGVGDRRILENAVAHDFVRCRDVAERAQVQVMGQHDSIRRIAGCPRCRDVS